MTHRNLQLLEPLLDALCDESITDEQLILLQDLVESDSACCKRYVEMLHLQASLQWDYAFEDKLVVQPEPAARRPWTATALGGWLGTINHARAFSLSFSAAFLFALVTLLALARVPWGDAPRSLPVASPAPAAIAEVTAVSDCRWLPSRRRMLPGTQIFRDDTLRLADGLLELTFGSGTRIVLEGPLEVKLAAADRVELLLGAVVAEVAPADVGFQVTTPKARVVDLGTEFAVRTLKSGETTVHVFDGRVTVESGREASQAIEQGEAVRVSESGAIMPVALDEERFVRRIDRITTRLDLADVIGGGDGTGTGRAQGITLATGAIEQKQCRQYGASARFSEVTALPFVDGVFVPLTKGGRQQITSAGHQVELPATDHLAWDHLWNGANLGVRRTEFGGVNYALPPHSLIGMHAKKGITFDLQAIRNEYPQWEITRMTAVAGDTFPAPAEFRVFLDGQEALVQHVEPVAWLDVAIEPQHRFLTLIALRGRWTMLGDAQLHLRLLDGEVKTIHSNSQDRP